MKYGVIDIGSNSVRLMAFENGKTLYKDVTTTRLASAKDKSGNIDFIAANETVKAVARYVEKAKAERADKIYAFATAAMRLANNGEVFSSFLKSETGIDVEILSGEDEARAGYVGALNGKDGGVIDIGGASTEIAVVENGEKVYGKSVDIGAVTLTRACLNDERAAEDTAKKKLSAFGNVPRSDYYCIGGTATSAAAMLLSLSKYDPNKTHGYVLRLKDLVALKERLYLITAEERKKIKGLQPERADIIQSGICILCELANYLNVDTFTVSERDNLEGFLALKTEKL